MQRLERVYSRYFCITAQRPKNLKKARLLVIILLALPDNPIGSLELSHGLPSTS